MDFQCIILKCAPLISNSPLNINKKGALKKGLPTYHIKKNSYHTTNNLYHTYICITKIKENFNFNFFT